MSRLTALRALPAALFLTGAVTLLPGAAPTAHAATVHQVLMSGYAFSPRTLTVAVGDTVTWTNQDQAPHDVKTTSGPASLHSPMLDKGGTWSHTFTVAGSYGYVCTVHPGMTARLVVKPAAVPTPTAHPTAHRQATSAPAAAPPATPPTRTAASVSHARSTGEATAEPDAAPSSSAAAGSGASAGSPAPAAAADVQSDATAVRPLDPLLLLAGLVAGVAVLCLLLVGSRSAATAPRTGDPGFSGDRPGA